MPRMLKIALLATALSLLAGASANATTGPAMVGTNGTPGIASNLGSVSGNNTSYAAHTFGVGGAAWSCSTASFDVLSTTTTSVTVQPTYSGCVLLVSGTPVATAILDTPCSWQLTFTAAVFNNSTGAGTGGTVDTGCTNAVTVAAWNCEMDVAAQTKPGISTQNIDATGFNSTSATPWGSKTVASVTGLAYTVPPGKTCPGIPTSGTMTYAGIVATRNVFGAL